MSPAQATPHIRPAPLEALRPTQMTLGLREVTAKRNFWRAQTESARASFLACHIIPVVLGPGGRHYLLDRHHLARALYEEGVAEVPTTLAADLSGLEVEAFWASLAARAWLHPCDAHGRRWHHTHLPEHIRDLADDPYRSLAGALRRAGGYAKTGTPFSEFLWADFLRRFIPPPMLAATPEAALAEALRLAAMPEAAHLPGWRSQRALA
jgi:hypothetical protein